MTKSESGRSVRLALALALTSCVPGVHGTDPPPPGGPISEPPPARPTGPPPSFSSPPKNSDKPAKPVIGGTLAVLGDARTAVAADPDRDRIFVADYRQKKVLADLPLQPGDEPGRVVADGEGRVHVALRGGGAVVTLLPAPWRIAARRPVCSAPRGLAYDADQRQIHVACAEGELVSLPVEPEGAPVRRLTLERDLRDVVVDGSVLLVSKFRSAEVLTVDRDGKIVARQTPSARRTFRPKSNVAVDESGTSTSNAGDVSESHMTASVGWRMIGLQTGVALMLHQRGLDDEVSETPGGYGGAECGGIVETVVSRVGALTGQQPAPTVSSGPVTVDLALAPDGHTLAMVSPGQARMSANGGFPPGFGGQVTITDVAVTNQAASECNPMGSGGFAGGGFAPDAAVVGTGGVGGGDDHSIPDAGAPDDGGSTADAAPPDDLPPPTIDFRQPTGEAVAVAFDIKGHLLVQTREPASLQVLTTTGNDVVLSYDSRADTGHDIFHSNAGAGIACASCHPEGGDDGRVWKFRNKQGVLEPRRTQNLRGGVLATAPFHWNGDLNSMGTLMNEVFVQRMAGPSLGDDYVEKLGKWLDTIPALPKVPPRDPQAAMRGAALFASAQTKCVTCHIGSLMTNNTTVDVGTGRTFQVPSLRGIAWRAPFMHDGCAATLTDRFTDAKCGGGDKHGVTSKLTAAQISDLNAFLETL